MRKVTAIWEKQFSASQSTTRFHNNLFAEATPVPAVGGAAAERGRILHAELPGMQGTNHLFSASSLALTWETHFCFPHLRFLRKHLSSSYFLIWVMNFYFLMFLEPPILIVSRMSINTLRIPSQFSFQLVKERNLCLVYPPFETHVLLRC